jgi:hypothetical protein
MSERQFDMEEDPVIERGTNDTQPLTTAEMDGAAAARQIPISDHYDSVVVLQQQHIRSSITASAASSSPCD